MTRKDRTNRASTPSRRPPTTHLQCVDAQVQPPVLLKQRPPVKRLPVRRAPALLRPLLLGGGAAAAAALLLLRAALAIPAARAE